MPGSIDTPHDHAATTAAKTPGKNDLLSVRPVGRILEPTQMAVAAEFQAMADVMGRPLAPEVIRSVGENSGTHILKSVSPKAVVGQNALRFPDRSSNRGMRFRTSGGAGTAPVQKLLSRPLEIRGAETKSILDHITDPDEHSRMVFDAFREVFGEANSIALHDVIGGDITPVTRLPRDEFPVIFVPHGPKKADLQITPITRPQMLEAMHAVREPFLQKKTAQIPSPRRGRWSTLHLTSKIQNVSVNLRDQRVRFNATVPVINDRVDAMIRAYAMGGKFPALYDEGIRNGLLDLGQAIESRMDYASAAMVRGLDQRAEIIVRNVYDMMLETHAEAVLVRAGIEEKAEPRDGEGNDAGTEPRGGKAALGAMRDMPSPGTVIVRMFSSRKDADEARKIVASNVFQAAEKRVLA